MAGDNGKNNQMDFSGMEDRELLLFTARSVQSLVASLTTFQRDYHMFHSDQMRFNEQTSLRLDRLERTVGLNLPENKKTII